MAMSVDEYYQTVLGRPADAEAYQAWGTTIDSSELGLLNQAAAYEQSLSGYQAPIPYSNPGITMEPVALASGATPSVVDYTPSGAPIFSWEQQAPQTPYYAPEATPVPINFDPWASGGTQHPNIVIGGGPTGGLLTPTPTTPTAQTTGAATNPTVAQGPRFDAYGRFLGGATPFKWGDFPIETGTVVNDYGIESLLRANILPGQAQFTNFQTIDQLRQAQPGLFRITVPGGAPGQVAYMEFEKTPDGKYIARETGGHTSLQDMLDNRVNEDDNSLLGMGTGMDLLALGGLLWAGGAFGGGGLFGGSEAALMDSAMGAGGFNTAAPGGIFNVAGTGLTAGEIAAMGAAMGAGGYNTAAVGGIFAPSAIGATGVLGAAGATGAAGVGSTLGSIGGALGSGLGGALLSGGANLLGGYLQNQTNRGIANQNADLIRQANEDKRFRPVGVTTRFGQSQFGYDANGRLTFAGYTLSPELKAMQDRQMGMLPQLQTDYERAAALGRGAMKTPEQYMQEQLGLLAPTREQGLAAIRNQAQQTGRAGLATGGTSTTMATNPELAAYYNAIERENARLAANAPQQSLALASQGLGLMSEGYRPFATALGGAQNMETLGQGAMDIGTQLGAQASTAGARLQTPQMPNQVNPWTAGLMGGVNAYQQYQARQPVTTQNPYVPLTSGQMMDQNLPQMGYTDPSSIFSPGFDYSW